MKKLLFIFLLLFTTNCFAQSKIATITKDVGKQTYRCTLGAENDSVVIGDEKNSTTFKPQITFNKWTNPKTDIPENHLTIKLPDGLIVNPTLSTDVANNKITIQDAKTGFYFQRFDDDNFKFGIILYEKPLTNTFSFQLEGWEEFDFFYQPPLVNIDEEYIENGKVYIKGIHPNGLKTTRLKIADGSWAVYHKTKRDYIEGQVNYGCGKVFQIYNITLIDALGKTLTVIPQIKDGVYTITIDQKYLDEANYPIKFNDTLGDSGIGTNFSNGFVTEGHGPTWGNYFTSPASAGTASVYKFCIGGSSSYHIKGALYQGGNLVANSSTGALTVAHPDKPVNDGEWTSGAITASILASTSYFLAFNMENDDTSMAYDSVGICYGDQGATNYASFPAATISLTSAYELTFSVYVTYTPSGGGAATSEIKLNGTVNLNGTTILQ